MVREHSIETMARILSPLLEHTAEFPTPGLGERAIDTTASPLETLQEFRDPVFCVERIWRY